MAVKEFSAGTKLIQSEQPLNAIHVITKGMVRVTYPGGEYYLTKGDVIGACELDYDSYFLSYTAEETTSLASYACSDEQLFNMINANPDMAHLIVTSLLKQFADIIDQYELARFDCTNFYQYLMDSYNDYLSFCTKHNMSARSLPGLEELSELTLEEDIDSWTGGYYRELRRIFGSLSTKNLSPDFILGLIKKTSHDVQKAISICRVLHEYKSDITKLLMNENHLDFFDLYASILYRIGTNAEDSTPLTAAISTMMIQLEGQSSIDKTMYESRVTEYRQKLSSLSEYRENTAQDTADVPDLANSLDTILSYAGCSEETASAFKAAISKYSKLTDKNSNDDSVRKLRLTITKLFYEVYEKAFLRSVHDFTVPKVIQMFFNFGYVDEHLAGMDNAAYLYSLVDNLPTDPSRHVYSIYEWLLAIYQGKKTPSRNEFDVDYLAHLRELKMTGKITEGDELSLQNSNDNKLQFEIQNMFPCVNKITFGRVSTFCPVFSEHNILKALPNALVSADKIETALRQIRAIDFSAYYRDMIYTNPDLGISKEYVSVEILPDVILMPNIGVRGVMWQEIEGRKRTTPSRMMVSVFQMEDLYNILIRLTADFRWEMCKRVQGARWNDVTDASLTSEYFDYIQFYKKNRELSAEAKDKVKLGMQKAKNSFKEMFIRDYESWILYEGTGSPRLNKVSRNILFTYCPFSKEVRDKLRTNPLYRETMDRYDVKLGQKKHHFDNLFQKFRNMGVDAPAELVRQKQYLDK